MKLAFSSNAFRQHSLLETIDILHAIGYQGIEIMADTPHAYPPELTPGAILAVAEALEQKGMAVANLNAFMLHAIGDTWRPSWIETEPCQRQKRLQHTLDCLDLAAAWQARTISTEPGGPLLGMGREGGGGLFRQGLQVVAARARQRGGKVLIEPEPGLLLESSSQFLDFLPGLDPEVFGLNFDIGHFFCVGEDPAALVSRLAPYTSHFHLEDIAGDRKHHHLMPGLGAIDLGGVLKAIAASGYDGFVTVELYPYEDRPIQAAAEAYDYLSRLASFG